MKPTSGSSHGVSVPRVSAPAQRTVGQLVADAIRLYGDRFWRGLLLGIPPVLFTVGSAFLDGPARIAFAFVVGPVLLAAAYTGAVALTRTRTGRPLPAMVAGIVAFMPLAISRVSVFPGIYFVALAWFAVSGLAVPVILVEGLALREAFRRAFTLARADFVHAFGSIATLAIVALLSIYALSSLLAGFGEQSIAIAALLAILVIAPVFFLGAALLYFDQVARHDAKRGQPLPRR